MSNNPSVDKDISYSSFKKEVLNDYKIAVTSRETSYLGRREVLTGKAKFGIFGDGKELPQIAMAKAFQNGDFRSGYYRDQTFMMAIEELTPQKLFAGLYAHTDIEAEPMSAGRQMGGHFNTISMNEDGSWRNLTQQKNSSSDVSCTAAQMPRLLGLAHASKLYRNVDKFKDNHFSIDGNEVAWGTIGNASTSEGLFFETLNAAGVLQVPMVISVWDDGYGISVENKHQTIKESISDALSGFARDESSKGFEILTVNGWDYPNLVNTYQYAGEFARKNHIPVLIHVKELTQPLGHSTSGSHERYKSKERLEWEKEFDCNSMMRKWIIENGIANEEELLALENEIRKDIKLAKQNAWKLSQKPIIDERISAIEAVKSVAKTSNNQSEIVERMNTLLKIKEPSRMDILVSMRKVLRLMVADRSQNTQAIQDWISSYIEEIQPKFSSLLYNEFKTNTANTPSIKPEYNASSSMVDGRVLLRDNFDALLNKHAKLLIFGEDTGKIGDVNQGLENLQAKHGEERVSDRGIREASIIGEGIGMALRGLRPIAEIQYLDYMLYALQILSDDLASLHYRTYGKQLAPLIIRTRGHRLEGIWHSGSPMGGLISLLRGIHILVPRNMTQAAGFYNTLLKSQEPAMVIESLNGYRLKEKMPSNLGEFTVPLGLVELLSEGNDITIVSYGSTLRLVEEAAKELKLLNIQAEVIDIQSLLPFDLNHDIVKSVQKTNRLLIVDEDVPGGASAFILSEVLEKQGGYQYLDSAPKTLTAKEHRPAYGSDGDYFSKPSVDDIIESAYAILHESDPKAYPKLR